MQVPISDVEPLLDVEGVKNVLALKDRRAAYRLIESGALGHVRIGRKVRVKPSQIREFIDQRTVA